jgi:hypothetical protein
MGRFVARVENHRTRQKPRQWCRSSERVEYVNGIMALEAEGCPKNFAGRSRCQIESLQIEEQGSQIVLECKVLAIDLRK